MATIEYHEEVLTDLEEDIDNLIADVAKEVLSRVKDRTPVDTGYAKSRWTIDTTDSGFDINNDADYISYLELGHSQQAPAGMLGITMEEVPDIVEEKAAKYRKE